MFQTVADTNKKITLTQLDGKKREVFKHVTTVVDNFINALGWQQVDDMPSLDISLLDDLSSFVKFVAFDNPINRFKGFYIDYVWSTKAQYTVVNTGTPTWKNCASTIDVINHIKECHPDNLVDMLKPITNECFKNSFNLLQPSDYDKFRERVDIETPNIETIIDQRLNGLELSKQEIEILKQIYEQDLYW